MREQRIIDVQDATLWTQKDLGDLLNINFAIPHGVALPFSALSEEEAREKHTRLVLKAAEVTRKIGTRADQDQWIEAIARREGKEVEKQQVWSGMEAVQEQLLFHLKAKGYAARKVAWARAITQSISRSAYPSHAAENFTSHARQPIHHPRTSLGAAGHWIHMAGLFTPVAIGELVTDAEKRWRSVRLASVGTALAYEAL